MEPTFTVAVCGGGNLAHGTIATLGHMNSKIKVNMLSRRPEVWQESISAYTDKCAWAHRGTMVGKINKVSKDPQEVVSDADVIIICSPAHTKADILKQIKPHLKQGALVGSIFGQGGFDMQANGILGDDIVSKKLTVFCLQYVPFICKCVTYGKDINIIGPKKRLYATSYPMENINLVCNVMSNCYHIPTFPIANFLNLTLCPSNQIIHPGRVYAYFKDWDGEKSFDAASMPLLYEDLDEEGAQEIQLLDDEIQAIKKAILAKFPEVDLRLVAPIKDRICSMYDGQITDKSSLKRIFNTNLGYSRVTFPMLKAPGQDDPSRVILNKNARFFWEDVPFGLVILKDIGRICGVETPNCTKQIIWHQKFMPVKYVDAETGEFIQDMLKETGAPSAYGITTIEELVKTSLGDKSSMDIYSRGVKL